LRYCGTWHFAGVLRAMVTSEVDLTFATHLPRPRDANVKSKTPLETYSCFCNGPLFVKSLCTNLIASIMLLSVVGTKTPTPCHQIQSRQVNLGRVICRSIHSTTPDLAKPSSRRRDLRRTYRFRLVPNPLYLLCGRSGLAP